MNKQHDAHQEGDRIHTPSQGVQMFKDHIDAMRHGSWLLGGEREKTEREGSFGSEDK